MASRDACQLSHAARGTKRTWSNARSRRLVGPGSDAQNDGVESNLVSSIDVLLGADLETENIWGEADVRRPIRN